MDIDMSALLDRIAEAITEAPQPDAPADYLHQRSEICATALAAVRDGAHPAPVLEEMEESLREASLPASEPAHLPLWRPTLVPA